jgi:predicted kinase
VTERSAEGVLLTGVYGSGKSSVAAEIAFLLEEQGAPFALLDLDYLSWTGPAEVHAIRAALSLPLKVVRLTVPLAVIQQRLASDVTSGRRDDLREAAASIANETGAGLEDVTISNDRPIAIVAQELMTFLGWL